jgi:hypothetical protein
MQTDGHTIPITTSTPYYDLQIAILERHFLVTWWLRAERNGCWKNKPMETNNHPLQRKIEKVLYYVP